MTLWWLWNIDYKGSWAAVEFKQTRINFVRGIIEDYIEGRCETLKQLYNRHYGKRNEETQVGPGIRFDLTFRRLNVYFGNLSCNDSIRSGRERPSIRIVDITESDSKVDSRMERK
jgi:hypothetical protein